MTNQKYRLAVERFQKKPELYYTEVLNVSHLEDYQRRVIQAVAENERVAIRACHDLGKTFLAARVVHWFLGCYKYSKVITTAPTYNQVKNILWSEIRSAHNSSKIPLGGQINLTDWKIDDGWFAIGFTPRNELSQGEGQGTQSSFQGFHAEGGVLLVFDEATGIPHNIWTMAEGLMTSSNVKFLAIGNPTSTASEFYQCFRSPQWFKIALSCFDSPNLIANGITNLDLLKAEVEHVRSMPEDEARKYLDTYKVPRPYLLTTKWVVNNIMKWGFEHPLSLSKILGEFPKAGDNTLVPLDSIEESFRRVYWPIETDRKTIGVDVARFGSDSTVLTAMHGKRQTHRIEMFKRDTIEVAGRVLSLANEIDADIIVVDETGVGSGVVDQLRDTLKNKKFNKTEVRGVQFGDACENEDDKEKYVNLKARMFGLLSQDMKAEDGIQLLNESVYLEELPSILYSYDKKGRMQIESKDEYKRRTGRKSPDNADSLALANYGRYDELTIGKFGKQTVSNSANAPFSGSIRSNKNW